MAAPVLKLLDQPSYNISKPAVTAVSYPLRVGKIFTSHVPIPDRLAYGADRFTPIHTSLEAVRCSPRLDEAKAFNTVCIDGILYKLTLLNFPSYIVHLISSYLRGRTSKRPSRRPRHLVEACGPLWLRVD